MPKLKLITILNIALIISCTTQVTKTRTVKAPYTWEEEVPYTTEEKVPKYKTIKPVFPLPENRPMKLAILPFTSSTDNNNDGIEIAEEIEYAMLKQPESDNIYKLLNRTQLSAVFTEKELAGLNIRTIKKTRKMLHIEGLITGHIKHKTDANVSFILKAINTKDASYLLNQRFQGNYSDVIKEVVKVFFEHKIQDGFEIIKTTEYRTEEKQGFKTKEEEYVVNETDFQTPIFAILGLVGLVWLTLKLQ